MKWIGLTGGLASGKSTAAEILLGLHIPIVDADKISHQCLEVGTVGYQKVLQVFGPGFVDSQNKIDRRKLGQHIFSSVPLREKLEGILHPLIQQEVLRLKDFYQNAGERVAIYDVPLLFEKNLQKQFDGTLLISCSPQTQILRMKKRNNWNDEEIQSRMKAQLPLSEKEKLATWTIRNEGSPEELKFQIEKWIQSLK